jgi:hypothetical protein
MALRYELMPNPIFPGHGLPKHALDVWLLLITVEVIHGILRTTFLVPVVGDFRARQIGVFIGSALILVVAYLFIGWLKAPSTKSLLFVGLLWLVLTVAFELGFGHFVFGRSWESLGEDYDVPKGGLLPFGLVVLALSPLIAARLRGVKQAR